MLGLFAAPSAEGASNAGLFPGTDGANFDPAIVSLFANSSPATARPEAKGRSERVGRGTKQRDATPPSTNDDSDEPGTSELDVAEGLHSATNGLLLSSSILQQDEKSVDTNVRKRKRKTQSDDLEGEYLQRLARAEEKEDTRRKLEWQGKKMKLDKEEAIDDVEDDEEHDSDEGSGEAVEDDEAVEDVAFDAPQHETLSGSKEESDMEKATRTVFLANVATSAITSKTDKKTLLKHLESFIPSLPASTPPHSVESLRFRSTAFSSAVPKKAAFARKDLMDTTTKSTNAYVVYSTPLTAREAAKWLNGTVVLDRHLRVDEVAHPAKIDHRRCVFVGNLGFVDDESNINAAREQDGQKRKSKPKPPGDVEEGLWQQFSKAGTVESVRVVRDPKTRVGKGFAYVQFENENSVEAALLFNEKKFPPMLPRKLRVMRAKKVLRNDKGKTSIGKGRSGRDYESSKPVKSTPRDRTSKLVGRAGAAKLKSSRSSKFATGANRDGIKPPEHYVFEGHRASSTQGNRGLRLGGSGKKKGKPRTRSAKRGTAWKAKGSDKAKK